LKDNPELLSEEECPFSPLHIACEQGNLPAVRALLKIDRSLAHRKEKMDHQNPAHICARYGHLECLKALVESEPTCVFALDGRGFYPAHEAAQYNQVGCLSYLLRSFPNFIRTKGRNGFTLAHAAIYGGNNADVIDLLIELCPEIFGERNSSGSTPLSYAIRYFFNKSAKMIIDRFPEILYTEGSEGFNRPIHLSAIADSPEMVAYILQKDPGLLHQRDAYGACVYDRAASLSCRILFVWYGQFLFTDSALCIRELSKAVKDGERLSVRAAGNLIKYYQDYWPDGLKDLVITSASPRAVQRLTGSKK
jgi:ankyrin repeat protein